MKKNMLIYGIILFVIGVFLTSVLSPILSFSGASSGLISLRSILGIVGVILMSIGGLLVFIGVIFYLKDEIGSGLTSNSNLDPFQTTQKTQTRYCPSCGRSIPFDSVICPYCSKKY